jgi:hypothetical protein
MSIILPSHTLLAAFAVSGQAGAAGFDAPIGSGLSDGLTLVYESGGVAQTPWVYDSVHVVEREGFERCVRVARRGQRPDRENA